MESEEKFNELIKTLKDLGYVDADIVKVNKAWEFAKLSHFGQKRLSGEDYSMHGLETAKIIASWKLDLTSIIVGMLHDTVDDGAANLDDILREFGKEISGLVDGVSTVSKIRLRGSDDEIFIENLRKMFLSMAKDLRVVLIKLADRLHNMRTLSVLPVDKQIKIAKETQEIYAPLSERLGMGEVKAELNELSFPILYPKEYEKVTAESGVYYKKAEERIKKIKTTLLRRFSDEGIKVAIDVRKKTPYSLWKKLERPDIKWNFDKIYDIVAARVFVETVRDCYAVLGIIHRYFRPLLGSHVSDFIAQPKPNGYQSIHTKVYGPNGKIVEFQIRTHEMHESAEYGVAAHWAYSELKSKGDVNSDQLEKMGGSVGSKLSWVKQLASWQSEIKDSNEFLEAVKFDALSERIFVFSPKGDVFDLPVGSTPIDFAYAVHTSLGDFISGAKINGRIFPLSQVLKNGDVVEILKSKNSKNPNSDWLEFVKTRIAKSEIKKHLNQQSKF
ncbi:MAG: (P)ppGpp synthetase I, SpoT/RelA [Candidatus Woesebacteria bacterium GW2011_GWA1_37_8]|uniref:(P)ppGpp synthetase I, SpoT/RelA n=2 Tax=Candidatus Woeseibacteriota TaxID=1752722 RepID=A0A0G0LH74_9BACT|nr:MAG: (P)ppGpp synthetase I, SpoT/RelA [Microgenomates group bacterium GW2011_GWC1_37_12b]KKQ44120.1 MAG: (P)ppGpp synthetase I, SpoT/RelA [Candidatus Woesebacteria bacterium GW2011_GWA1_37_8]KKQ87275.1 MAG: (P)ppGpp synthetase I, SpoT/RelA [Candidatus Woesebacteria bacterium GW2011_GWB1_38_8b]